MIAADLGIIGGGIMGASAALHAAWRGGRADRDRASPSGHGFKFGPLIGRMAAELLTRGRSTLPPERFA